MAVKNFDLIYDLTPSTLVSPDAYRLDNETMNSIEGGLVSELRAAGVQDDVVTVVTGGYTSLADFGRTQEEIIFKEVVGEVYDFPKGMQPYEERSIFLLTVDTAKSAIAHVKRIVVAKSESERIATGLTGIEVFDDRIIAETPDEACSLQEILDHHGIDSLDNCFNVTTNVATRRVEPTLRDPYSLISYKAVFELAKKYGASHVVAYQNSQAIKSLGKLGTEYDLLAGREFHLPVAGQDSFYDEGYLAVVIPASDRNVRAFTEFNPDRPLTRLIADRKVPVFYKPSDEGGVRNII